MAARKSPKKGASPPKKTRQSPSKAKAAALEAEVAAEEPSQRVTKASPAKGGKSPAKKGPSPAKKGPSPAKKGQSPAKSPRKTASPSKVTKSKSPAKSAAKKASPTKAKDTRFRGVPEESSDGYKAEESSEDIIKAIDGRTLTKLDKILVAWIREHEQAEDDFPQHDNTASQVVDVLELPYGCGEEPSDKAHFNLYWRFRTLFEQDVGPWPSAFDDVEMEESEDDGSEAVVVDDGNDDDGDVAVDSRRARVRALTSTTSAIKHATEAALKKKQSVYLDNIKAKARQSFMTRGRYDFIDEPKYDRAAKDLKISVQAFKDAIDKGLGSAIRALPAEDTLRTLGTNRGQPMFPQRTTEEGIAIGYAGDDMGSFSKTPKTKRPITQGTPSPQKSADPRQAEKERMQREAKRIADVKARNALITKKEVYPPTKANTPLPYASRRGNIVSSTNPGTISIIVGKKADGIVEKKERLNPFFETLPGPEVWHRNMPPYFSFGETKLMEQIISDQINADLARKHDDVATTATEGRAKKTVHATDITLRKDQWELPQLTEAEEKAILAEVRKYVPGYTGQAQGPPSKKRPYEMISRTQRA